MPSLTITNFFSLFATYKKKIVIFLSFLNQKKYLFYFFLISFFFTIYALVLNQVKSHTELKENNFNYFLESSEFSNIKDFILENIKSPYKEYIYTVENNDTLEKILKKYKIKNTEINKIAIEVRKKKLFNIYAGTEIKIVTKKEKEDTKIISLFYPIDGITSVQIKKVKDEFTVTKNILKLNRKEIVLSNTIKNNLYSSAIQAGIEPNIIVEFANIFGFEVDFQRDIRTGDSFEVYYERYVDDDNVVKKNWKNNLRIYVC